MDKRNYHVDEKKRFPGERYAAIVIKENNLLLIHRIKDGYEYWVFPGGHKWKGENGGDTAIRETKEETNIDCSNAKLIFEFNDHLNNKTDYYYICDWEKGENPSLNGEEAEINSQKDFYEPIWLPLNEVENLNILPKFAKYWLLENINNIFTETAIEDLRAGKAKVLKTSKDIDSYLKSLKEK